MLKIGLTGGIGSGKTTVSNYLAAKGIPIIDADVLAKAAVAKGSFCLAAIRLRYGESILLDNGSLNREKLRQIIFSDAKEKHWLERLTHPHIRQMIVQRINGAECCPYVVLSSPLLIETKQNQLVDRVVLVDLPVQQQLARASARDKNSQAQIAKIIATQMPREQRLQYADDILDNSGSEADTLKQADVLHQSYLALAKRGQIP